VDKLKNYLTSDELVIWEGKPHKNAQKHNNEIIGIVGIFALLLFAITSMSSSSEMLLIVGIVQIFVGLVFGLLLLYLFKHNKFKDVFYYITNKRVIWTSTEMKHDINVFCHTSKFNMKKKMFNLEENLGFIYLKDIHCIKVKKAFRGLNFVIIPIGLEGKCSFTLVQVSNPIELIDIIGEKIKFRIIENDYDICEFIPELKGV